jgi:predicted polyphosphate/ATP-dependent NAD kinase
MKMGFIVNPIAGMGGKVGLKGTDEVLEDAIVRGAKPIAPNRAITFLLELKGKIQKKKIKILTCPKSMGEDEVKTATFSAEILPLELGKYTTANDTKKAVKLMVKEKIDLLVFVGGDGTAKDVFDSIKENKEIPVLGVPSGVKMYSGVFAFNPSDAADVILAFIQNQAEITESEIIDTEESDIRRDILTVKLYGLIKVPFLPIHIQRGKEPSLETLDEKENQTAIARFIIEEMEPKATYILGPGTTTKCVLDLLGLKKTLLGVDLYKKGEVLLDVNERVILDEVESWRNTWIILSPIGRQGVLFGRGNLQISSEIIKFVGKEKIIVAATKRKLKNIDSGTLRVDSDDKTVNEMLRGYIKVVTDYREYSVMPIF